jgi:hypothetical protein
MMKARTKDIHSLSRMTSIGYSLNRLLRKMSKV